MASRARVLLRMPAELHHGLKRRAAGRRVSLNRECVAILEAALRAPTLADLPGAIGLDHGLAAHLRHEYGPAVEGLVLFGSAAREEMTEASDVDLLVVLAPGVEITRALYRRWDEAIRPALPAELRARVVSHFVALPRGPAEAGGLWYEVAIDGRVIVEEDGVVSRLLRGLRAELASGAVTRRVVHGHPYWVRALDETRAE